MPKAISKKAKGMSEKDIQAVDLAMATEITEKVVTCKVDLTQVVATRPKGSEIVLMCFLCHKADMSTSFAKGLPNTIALKIIELGKDKWASREEVARAFGDTTVMVPEQLVAFVSVAVLSEDASLAKLDNPAEFNGIAFTASWALKYDPADPNK